MRTDNITLQCSLNVCIILRRLDLKCLNDILRRFVLALLEVGSSADKITHFDKLEPQHVTAACNSISAILPPKDDPHFWEVVKTELLAALKSTEQAECCLQQCDDISKIELALLERTSVAKVHLGVAMGLVLCPPVIDPVTISATENHFLSGIVCIP